MASTKETKRITEEEAKEQIIADLEKRGLGKKPLTFLLTGTRNNHSLRPKTRHVYTGKNGETYVFNLRYTPVSPTAIENDQNINGPVELRRVDFPGDRWTVYPEDRGLQMFLMLHPFYGKNKVFYVEDLEADAAIEESMWTDMGTVIELCKTSDFEVLQAVYATLKGVTTEMNPTILRAGILDKMKNGINPREIIEMFGDKRNTIKFKIQSGIRLNILKMNARKTELSWTSGGVIYTCAPGLNIISEFAEWAMTTEEGGATYDKIITKLNA